MIDKATRKSLKKIKKEITKLKNKFKSVEFRPCQSDEELRQKEMDLKTLMEKINALEKEQDKYILYSSRVNRES